MPRFATIPMAMLVLSSLLTACASVPASSPRPEPPAQRWSSFAAQAAGLPGADDMAVPSNWWAALDDPVLDGLIGAALEDSPDLRAAAARVAQARALQDMARARRMPRAQAGVGAERGRVQASAFRDGEGSRFSVPPYRSSSFSAQVSASYDMDLFGRLALAEHEAQRNTDATRADRLAVRQWLIHDVVRAYADIRMADALRPDIRNELGLARQLLAAEASRKEAGLVPAAELRRTADLVAERERLLAEVEGRRHEALSRLAVLMGRAPSQLELAAQERYFTSLKISGSLRAGLPASVVANRPDIDAAWHRVLAGNAAAERARRDRYPSLSLTGTTGFLSESLRRWLTGDALGWALAAAVNAPLFDGGGLRAEAARAAAAGEELEAAYRKTVLAALGEVDATLGEIVTAKVRREIAATGLARRKADHAAAQAALAAGASRRDTVLRAEMAMAESSRELSERQYELLLCWASAHRALGL